MEGSRKGVEEALRDGDAHYGVNTSFGAVQLPDILDNVEQVLAIEPSLPRRPWATACPYTTGMRG